MFTINPITGEFDQTGTVVDASGVTGAGEVKQETVGGSPVFNLNDTVMGRFRPRLSKVTENTAAARAAEIQSKIAAGNIIDIYGIWDVTGQNIDFTAAAGCTLNIEGKIIGANIIGNETNIPPKFRHCLENCTFQAAVGAEWSFDSEYVVPLMFGAKDNTKSADQHQMMGNYTKLAKCNVLFTGATYLLEHHVDFEHAIWQGDAHFQVTPDFTELGQIGHNPALRFGFIPSANHYSYKYAYNHHDDTEGRTESPASSGEYPDYVITEKHISESAIEIPFDAGTDISALNKGDYVMIWSQEVAQAYYNDRKGVQVKIWDIDYDKAVISIDRPVGYNFDVENYPVSVSKVEIYKCKFDRFTLRGIHQWEKTSTDSYDIQGAFFGYIDGLSGYIDVSRFSKFGVYIQNCEKVNLIGPGVNEIQPHNVVSYALEFAAPNNNVTITGFNSHLVRHAVDAISGDVGYGVTDNVNFIAGEVNGMDNIDCQRPVNPHGGMRNVTFTGFKFNGNTLSSTGGGALLETFNDAKVGGYSTDDIVTTSGVPAKVTEKFYSQNFISLADNNTDPINDTTVYPAVGATWKRITSILPYSNRYEQWGIDVSVSVNGNYYQSKNGYFKAAADGLTTTPDYGVNGWIPEFNTRINQAIGARSLQGWFKFVDCTFKNYYSVFVSTLGNENKLSFENCEVENCNYFATDLSSSEYNLADIRISGLKLKNCGAMFNFDYTPDSFPAYLILNNVELNNARLFSGSQELPQQLEYVILNNVFQTNSSRYSFSYSSSINKVKVNSTANNLKKVIVNNSVFDKSVAVIPSFYDPGNAQGGALYELHLNNVNIATGSGSAYSTGIMQGINPSKIFLNDCHIDQKDSELFNFRVRPNELHISNSKLYSTAAYPIRYLGESGVADVKVFLNNVESNFDIKASNGSSSTPHCTVVQTHCDKRKNGYGVYETIASPEGVISDNVDATCTNILLGWKYKKVSGTGNTGWLIQPQQGRDPNTSGNLKPCTYNLASRAVSGTLTLEGIPTDDTAKGLICKSLRVLVAAGATMPTLANLIAIAGWTSPTITYYGVDLYPGEAGSPAYDPAKKGILLIEFLDMVPGTSMEMAVTFAQ